MDQTSSVPAFIAAFATIERSPAPPCGCAIDPSAALPVDPSVRYPTLTRLRRIEGQVRGLQKMVEEDRYCADIMMQVSSVHEALRAVGRELMRNHLRHCASVALRSGQADPISDDIIEMIYRTAR
jgi:DNA-binding FrmR family transcriptional regulator